jgi:hypothetical protein
MDFNYTFENIADKLKNKIDNLSSFNAVNDIVQKVKT